MAFDHQRGFWLSVFVPLLEAKTMKFRVRLVTQTWMMEAWQKREEKTEAGKSSKEQAQGLMFLAWSIGGELMKLIVRNEKEVNGRKMW